MKVVHVRAVCLALLVPLQGIALAEETTPSKEPTDVRQPLQERSVEDAQALERQLPASEQQQLQAGSDEFLSLWRPANTADAQGTVIIVPGAGETADWPQGVGPLRRKLPDAAFNSLSLSLPDLVSQMPTARPTEKPPLPVTTETQATPPDAGAGVEKATAQDADTASAEVEMQDPMQVDAERIFARIEAGIAFAQQHNSRRIVLLGHGSGAYWATRYMAERQPAHVQQLVLVDTRTPDTAPQQIDELAALLKIPTSDIYYSDRQAAADAAQLRLQASKRQKGATYSQVSLKSLPDKAAQAEQLFRRVKGALTTQ
jgi:pimeloyl-ACP methyl ester carboxylesterase